MRIREDFVQTRRTASGALVWITQCVTDATRVLSTAISAIGVAAVTVNRTSIHHTPQSSE